MMSQTISQVEVVTPPTIEPLTLTEAKKQNFVASSDTIHDAELARLIQAAREQWESDTDSALLTQTLRVTAENFRGDSIALPRRPIQSVTSITYYDSGDALQTLSSSIYTLDKSRRMVRRNWSQSWPDTYTRWDAVTVTYVAGFTDRSLVPAISKQAMLLLVGYYFDSNRGDNDRPNDMRAYEALVARFMRSTYP